MEYIEPLRADFPFFACCAIYYKYKDCLVLVQGDKLGFSARVILKLSQLFHLRPFPVLDLRLFLAPMGQFS